MLKEQGSWWFRVEPLWSEHDRAAFPCEIHSLENYFRTQAGQNVKKRAAVVYVLTSDGKTLAGYYTLSQYSVELDEVPNDLRRRLPKYPFVPVTLLGRLAASNEFRGKGIGEHLLMDALNRSLASSKQIGSVGVIVHAKDQNAANFYRKYGFIQLPKIPGRLFLPMKTIEEMLS
jgi:predicted GNAT family N-acyltransferase